MWEYMKKLGGALAAWVALLRSIGGYLQAVQVAGDLIGA